MTNLSPELWIAIVVIGVATYAARALPLFWTRFGDRREGASWLDRLGPCLLAAMAVAIILPAFREADGASEIFAATTGLVAAGCAMALRRDPGLATFVGMIAFYATSP